MSENTQKQTAELSKRYSLQKHVLTFLSLTIALIYLLFMGLFGSNFLKHLISLVTVNEYLLVAIYIFVFIIIIEVITIPLSFYSSFILEHMYKLSNQKISGWLKNEVKKFLISLPLIIIMVEIMYVFLRNFPNSWWIFVTIIWIFFSVIMAKLAPVLIFPLFYKSEPIDNKEVKEGLESLAEGTGINIQGVYKINLSKDTKKANAALAGMGSTRRVLLGDTLLDSYSLAEIKSVFAHELGHQVYHHIWKMLAIGTISGCIGFAFCHLVLSKMIVVLGYQNIHDIAAFPAVCLALAVSGFLLMPIQNAISRRFERACDRYAIEKTNDPEAFILTMDKLGEQNLADRTPHRLIEWLFYSHPSISKRIEMAKKCIKLKA
ncbi:MAG: M48 family metallopeptidase [Candidatus Scalindua sp.]|jgi:STE24 endopeptidase|nr:M48 family metallopeptidase [Candidatus Scalindua sp.]MBT5305592.1 M48 family metallopeptidase [Candidatus Scalindua sp.]MBT6047608.1 M48 family metallopeptidase [Candidatus Scalindua sp.]MBT6231516.1 M48 family metallopeptidase [Candidatus Scalindua sp.]MBT7212272.1 M48 family metallopeptidase [Candidatus Scalindua sp.]